MTDIRKVDAVLLPLPICLMLADIAQSTGREAEATRYVALAYAAIDRQMAKQS